MIRLLSLLFALGPALHATLPALATADQPSGKSPPPPCSGPRETLGTRGFSDHSLAKPADALLSFAQEPEEDPFARQVSLAPVDVQSLLAEDEQMQSAGRPLRVGVGRAVQVGIEDGQWRPLEDGGALWTVTVRSQGAVGIRLHFSGFDLSEGASVRLASPVRSDAVDGPFRGAGPLGDGAFWSTVLVGEMAYLEYHDPLGGAAPPDALAFIVDQVQHLYRDPLLAEAEAREGDCHNDVSCHSAWYDVRDAVARFTYVDMYDDSYLCTGQLLDTEAGDQTPYFLSAAHCIPGYDAAHSMVFYWKYQTAVCQGVPPNILSVPASSLGELVATDPANDMSLIMAIGELPPELFWAGWNAAAVADDTPLSCIHHPDGAYKRISFGTKTGEQDGRLLVDWNSNGGATEPGSSGGGAFLNSTQQLVGTLFGGPSSCTAEPQDRYDLFGSFEYAYPTFCPYLKIGSDDAWEPNGACVSAPLVAPGVYAALIVKNTDDDWYRLRSTSCGAMSVNLWFTDAYGDIDVELYDACGGDLLAESRTSGDTEAIIHSPGVSGEYWLRVFLNAGTRNRYNMSVTLDGVSAFYPATAGVPIPDNNLAGIQHSLFVPDHFTISDLDASVVIAHNWNGDLEVRLSHGATTVVMVDRPGVPPPAVGFDNDGFDVILDDAAVTPIESYNSGGPTVVGTFRPNSPLAAFNGQDMYGTWTLSVIDRFARDIGTLTRWGLYATRVPPPGGPCECGGDGDSTGDGNTDLADIAAMQRCFTGAGAGPVPSGCAGSNFDCDGDVDLEDVDYLIGVLTGPRQGGGTSDPPGAESDQPIVPPSPGGPPAGAAP